MEKLQEVRWGIIGVGDVCEVKSGPAFNMAEGSTLVAVMRRDAEKAKDYASRHNVSKWYDDADKLIADPDVNAIYIATPPDSHAHYAKLVAAAGKPAYVEKPMARAYTECVEMKQAFEEANVPLFVAYYRRVLPNFLKVKSLLEAGAIGTVRYVDIRVNKTVVPDIITKSNWRTNPAVGGGGYFYDLASHQIDLMEFLFGKITHAHGLSANQAGAYVAEDIVTGSFRFENGIMGTGTWCFSTSSVSDSEYTLIVGDRGEIIFSFFGIHSVTLRTDDGKEEKFDFEIPTNIQFPFIQTIVNSLLGKGNCPGSLETAVRVNKVLEQLTGIETGSRVA